MRHLLRMYREDPEAAADSSDEMLSDETKARIKEVLRKRMREKQNEDAQESPSDESTNAD